MIDETTTRRTVLRRTGAAVAGIGTALGAGYAGTRPTAAVEADDEFLAENVRIERNDGDVRSITVTPELSVQWRDFGGGIERIEVVLSASLEGIGGFDVLIDGPVEEEAMTADGDALDGSDGTTTITGAEHDLTAMGDAVTETDFGGDLDPGESRTTGVELVLRVDVTGVQGETATAVETATFDVTVHNPEGDATTTGRANTDGE